MARTTVSAGIALILLALTSRLVRAQTNASTGSNNPQMTLRGLDTRFIDTAANPCLDFAQYACGNFSKFYPTPYDHSAYSPSGIVAESTETVLHTLFETAASGGAGRTPDQQKIGDFYASCSDTSAMDQSGLKPLQPELGRIAALSSKDELAELLAHFQLINVTAFFTFGEQPDFQDVRKQIAGIDQGGLGLPDRDFYLSTEQVAEKTRDQYVRHISNILKLLGETYDKADDDAQKIMQLETALAKVSMDFSSRRDPKNTHHPMQVAQLSTLAPGIAWDRIFKATGAPAISELNVATPDFFKGLDALLASTDLETVKAYLRWQLIHAMNGLVLPQPFDDETFNFYFRKLRGQHEQRDRWKRCVQATDEALSEAVGRVYVAQEFPQSRKQAALQIVHDVEGAMNEDIESLDWMSATTKARAKDKLRAVADKIGYPDHWRDYSNLTVVRGDAFGNYLRAVEFENRHLLAKIGQPIDHEEWSLSPATVNAYYNTTTNDINFPAAMLQPPYYDPNATDAENYGHLGSAVGHELTHGFDDQGSKFDADGGLANWWTPEDAKRFEQKSDCEVEEYGNFVVDDVAVNGKLTLGENVADNGGARLAYIAFLADAKRKSIDLTKQQDGYTTVQQFFLAYGQNFCGSTRPQQLRRQLLTDPHAPRQFRVNGVLQNMPEFGKAFGCKTGDPMMPVNACRVW